MGGFPYDDVLIMLGTRLNSNRSLSLVASSAKAGASAVPAGSAFMMNSVVGQE